MLIRRHLHNEILAAAREFPVIAVLGPRQSGKTTLAQSTFPHHRYVNLEDLSMRHLAQEDPKLFLKDFANESGIIIDEAQHVPDLFSYIQVLADEQKANGFYVITGSQNFTLDHQISQSLAGRIARITLMPLSLEEINDAGHLPEKIEELVVQGGYPKLYSEDISRERLLKNYIETYVQKDVRQVKNITDLVKFDLFLRTCAAHTGQLLNKHTLANSLDISAPTVESWLSLLVSRYIIFLQQPYFKNYGKRMVKSPKLYFVDTGLACSLLGIRAWEDLLLNPLRGHLIETYLVSDLYKQYYNLDTNPHLYFWRDYSHKEVDVIIEKSLQPIAVEIKSSKTISPHYFDTVTYFNSISKTAPATNYIIYGGSETIRWQQGTVMSWQDSRTLIQALYKKSFSASVSII